MISTINMEKAGILMLQWIFTLPNTFLPRKYRVGYVPRLLFNVNYSGFEASRDGILDACNPTAFKTFEGDGSEYQWFPAQSTPPY